MDATGQLILEGLQDPDRLAGLGAASWDRLLPQVRQAGVLARLAVLMKRRGLWERVPTRVRNHLVAMDVVATEHQRIVRWEVNRISRALGPTGSPVIVLKGGAYVMANLPPSRGRLMSDVDIMVPKDRLVEVEAALKSHGWEPMKLDPYDQRYYRQWMHELPPMRHQERLTAIDVHHTILPESGRLHPDPQLLLESARPIDGSLCKVLAPADMILHSAVHLFQDGELAGGLRDLTDMDDLLRHFGDHEPGFWEHLVPRARQLGLQRPLFYALRYTRRLLGTPIPEPVRQTSQHDGPPWMIIRLMDRLVSRAMFLQDPDHTRINESSARWLLYVRSHWLRMPPHLLAGHLTRKALRRWTEKEPEEENM